MDEREWLAQRFQEHRPRMRALAYRMLGSTSEADDAVQEAWIRLSRSNSDEIDNLQASLLSVVGRVALNMLRSRKRRRGEQIGAILERRLGRRANSPAADAAASALHTRPPTPRRPHTNKKKWLKPSWPPPAMETSRRSSPC
jgi:DNA-directed RNA polymerase specialized sigma24 family protein